MSYWTHIDGFLTIKAYYDKDTTITKKLKKILGPQKDDEYWGEDKKRIGTLPLGSEGPLSYQIITNKHKVKDFEYREVDGEVKGIEVEKWKTDLVTIWFYGDLRDFGENDDYCFGSDNTKYIEHWFRDLVDEMEKKHMSIRSGLLEYEADDMKHGVLLKVIPSVDWNVHEIIRMRTPKDDALETKYV